MAISWGSYNNGARLGIDVTVPSPSAGASSITITARYYMRMQSPSYFNNVEVTAPLTGAITGNVSGTHSMSSGTNYLLGTKTLSVSLKTNTQTIKLGISATHFGRGFFSTTTYGSQLSVTIPRSVNVPSAPTGHSITRSGTSVTMYAGTTSNNGSGLTDWGLEYRARPSGGSYGDWTNRSLDSARKVTFTPGYLGGRYQMRSRARNALGWGSWSSIISIDWPNTPSAPTGHTLTRSGGTLNIYAGSTSNGGSALTNWAAEYRFRPAGGSYGSWTNRSLDGSRKSSWSPGAGSLGGTYQLRSRAQNDMGWGSWSSSLTLEWPNIPGTPSGVSMTRSGKVMTIYAGSAGSGGSTILEWSVERRSYAKGSSTYGSWTSTTPDSGRRYAFTPANLGGSYQARSRARNEFGWGPYSSISTMSWPEAPSAPSVSTSTTPTSLRGDWSAPASGGASITSYVTELQKSDGSWGTRRTLASSTRTVNYTGLVSGGSYRIRVAAVNDLGQSSWTTTSYQQLGSAPNAPTSVTITRKGAVSWPAVSASPPVTNYEISVYDGLVWSGWLNRGTGRTFSLTDMLPGVGIKARVRARNSAGTSGIRESGVTTSDICPCA